MAPKRRLRISTTPDQLREGLFGQIFLWIFEVLPHLDRQGILPTWAIRSAVYGQPDDFLVIPGLLEINCETDAVDYQDVNLQELRDRHACTLGPDWECAAQLWQKYFRWPARIKQRADEFPALNGALGIHYRGTDKNRSLVETNAVSADAFLALTADFVARHPAVTSIYVATDERAFIEQVRTQHPSLPVISSGPAQHHKSAVQAEAFAKGDHALLDCWLLSRCTYLLKCQSALSAFAKILNPSLDGYRISADKLAYWSHGIPYFPDAYFPIYASPDPKCQRILAELLAGDWTQNRGAAREFGARFRYKRRKGYARKNRGVPKWSFDGLQKRLDARLGALAQRFGF